MFAVSDGRDFWLVGAVRLAGVSCPARTDRLTGLRGVCLLAAGRAVKRLAIGCGWAARSAVVVAWGRDVFVGVFVGSVASTGPVYILNTY